MERGQFKSLCDQEMFNQLSSLHYALMVFLPDVYGWCSVGKDVSEHFFLTCSDICITVQFAISSRSEDTI